MEVFATPLRDSDASLASAADGEYYRVETSKRYYMNSTRHRATPTRWIRWTRRVRVPITRIPTPRRPASTANGFSPNSMRDGVPAPRTTAGDSSIGALFGRRVRCSPRGNAWNQNSGAGGANRHLEAEIQALQFVRDVPTRSGMVRSSNPNNSCPMSTAQRAGCDDILTGVPQSPHVAHLPPRCGVTPAERADAGCWHHSSTARSSRSRHSMTFRSR